MATSHAVLLGYSEWLPLALATVVHPDDVRVPQRRRQIGFPIESHAVVRVR